MYRTQPDASSARSKRNTCSICPGPHEVKFCPKKDFHRKEKSVVCPNCTGPHPASYRGCPKFKLAQDIVKVQTINKISYAQAVKKVSEATQGPKQSTDAQQTNGKNENAAKNNAAPKIDRPVAPSSESNHSTEGETTTNARDHGRETQPRTSEQKVNNKIYVSRKLVNTFFQATFKVLKAEATKEELIKNVYALIKRLNKLFDENLEDQDQVDNVPRPEGDGQNNNNNHE